MGAFACATLGTSIPSHTGDCNNHMNTSKFVVTRKSGVLHAVIISTDQGTPPARGDEGATLVGLLPSGTIVSVTVVGVSGSTFELAVDYPGTANDFKMVIALVNTNITLIRFTIPPQATT